jgi:hypothetical protein
MGSARLRSSIAVHHTGQHTGSKQTTRSAGRGRSLGRSDSHRPTTKAHCLVDRVFRLKGYGATQQILRLPPILLHGAVPHSFRTCTSRASIPPIRQLRPLSWARTAHCTLAKQLLTTTSVRAAGTNASTSTIKRSIMCHVRHAALRRVRYSSG